MIFVPLPFVVSLLLFTLLPRMLRRAETGERANQWFMLLISAYGVQSVLLGMRWGYDIRAVMPFQLVLAVLIAALAWLAFSGLAHEEGAARPRIWPHLLPAGAVVLMLLFWRDPIGPFVVAVFLSYGAALLWLAQRGPDGLVASRLDGVVRSYRALLVTAFALIGSAATDILISLDLIWNGGAYSGAVVGVANVLALLILGSAASIASEASSTWDDGEADPLETKPSAEDEQVSSAVDALMQTRELYKDAELNLGRIARRLGVSARSVSQAVNRIHRTGVSQYVNDFRVREACRLLVETDMPVTRIMFESGFQTKSNFNREFLRVTRMAPSAWRKAAQRAPIQTAVTLAVIAARSSC